MGITSHWAPSKTTIRTYRVPSRFFNLLFNIEDCQGDGFIRATIILFHRAIQLIIPFRNTRRYHREWSLLKRIS